MRHLFIQQHSIKLTLSANLQPNHTTRPHNKMIATGAVFEDLAAHSAMLTAPIAGKIQAALDSADTNAIAQYVANQSQQQICHRHNNHNMLMSTLGHCQAWHMSVMVVWRGSWPWPRKPPSVLDPAITSASNVNTRASKTTLATMTSSKHLLTVC